MNLCRNTEASPLELQISKSRGFSVDEEHALFHFTRANYFRQNVLHFPWGNNEQREPRVLNFFLI